MKRLALLLLFVSAFSPLPAAINPGGVVNAASFMPFGLPNAGIAQGSLFLVFGTDLGAPGLAQANEFPLPTTLAGTSAQVAVGGVTVDCAMVFTTPGQIALLLPSNTPAGQGEIRVTFNGAVSTGAINVAETSVGIFAQSQAGSGPGIVQNFVDAVTTPLNTLTSAATPGQALILWVTGLGAVAGDELAGALPGVRPAGVAVRVVIGGQNAQVVDFGRSGCCAGLDQIVAIVPQGLNGCYVSVNVITEKNGVTVTSNSVSIAVSPNGGECQDPTGLVPSQITSNNGEIRLGLLSVGRGRGSLTLPGFGSGTAVADVASATFLRMPERIFSSAALPVQLPQVGACTVFSVLGESGDPSAPSLATFLDAGPSIQLNSPGGSRTLQRFETPESLVYQDAASETIELNGQPQPSTGSLFAEAGTHAFVGMGGPDIGPFNTSLTIPGVFEWTNSQDKTISRSADHTVFWTGAAPGSTVQVWGSSTAGNAVGATLTVSFWCFANGGDGSFTIPAYILSSVPVSGGSFGVPFGTLNVTQTDTTFFSTPDIDIGLLTYTVGVQEAGVAYQ